MGEPIRRGWRTFRGVALGLAVALMSLPALADGDEPATDEPLVLEAAAVDAAALDAQAGNTAPSGSYQGGSSLAATDAPIGTYSSQPQMPTSEIGVTASSVSSSSLQATVAGSSVSLGQ